MPKISVIVPIYNVEAYLNKCIDSILAQSFEDFELILVDDGSTDGSGKIADKYAGRDGRITVLHKKNGGAAEARNVGIDVSHGDYIAFVDSDDWIESEYLRELYNLITESGADIAICGFVNNDGRVTITGNDGVVHTETGIEAIDNLYGSRYIEYVAVWNKLYRKEIFSKVRFPIGMICEDEAAFADIFLAADKVIRTEKKLYNYRINNSNSVMTSQYNTKMTDILKAIEMRMDRYQKEGLKKYYEKDSYKYLYKILLNIIAVKDSKNVDNGVVSELKKKYWNKYRESLGFDWTIARKVGMLFFGIFPRAFLLRYKK